MNNIPKIGELLLEKKIISRPQLDAALEEQSQKGGRLGPILVSLGYVSAEDIERILPAPPASKLGERLVENGAVTEDQLQKALEYQQENGGLLGEALVSLGYLKTGDIENNLLIMNRRVPIGEALVRDGIITAAQLDKALEFQRKSGGLIGDILLSLKMVSSDVLYRQLANQKQIGRPGLHLDLSQSKKLPFALAQKYHAVIINKSIRYYLLAVTSKLDDAIVGEIETLLNTPVEQTLASQTEIDMYWARVYGEELSWESTLKLAKEEPQNSARKTVTFPQVVLLLLTIAVVIWGFVADALQTAIIINIIIQVCYFLTIIFKMFIMMSGCFEILRFA